MRYGGKRNSQRIGKGIVVLVLKKEGGRVEDYKGVMLTQTAYKVYVSFGGEVERKKWRGKGYCLLVKRASEKR